MPMRPPRQQKRRSRRDYQQAERPDFVFGSILIIGFIGIIVYYGLRAVEARVFPWADMNRGEG